MSDQVPAIFTQKLPGFLAGRDRNQVAQMNDAAAHGTGGAGMSVNKISLKASRFRLVVGGEEVRVLQASHLDLVVVRANDGLNKAYYAKEYQPGQEPEAPDCFSEDGVRPSPESRNKQCDTCAACPMNQWGSKINRLTGKKIKACSDSKRVAVVPPTQPDGDLYQLAIPAASMGDFGSYLRLLNTAQQPVPYNALVTRVEFDTSVSYPKLKFSPVRYLTDDEYETVSERYDSEEALRTCGAGTAGLPEEKSVPAQPQAPAQEAAQEAEDDPFAEAAATTSKPAAKAQQSAKEEAEDDPFAAAAEEKPATKPRTRRAKPAKAVEKDPFAGEQDEPPAKAEVQGATIDGESGAVVESDDLDDVFGAGWD